MLYILVYLGVFGIWMLIELIRAPKGYESPDGFFLIKPEDKRIQLDSEGIPPHEK